MANAKAVVSSVSGTMFKSNEASLGGAVYIVSVTDNQHTFRNCGFEENIADDGGAVYLYTALAVDIFVGSVFRNNSAGESSTITSPCGEVNPCLIGPDQRPCHLWNTSVATLQLSKGYVLSRLSSSQIGRIQHDRVKTSPNRL